MQFVRFRPLLCALLFVCLPGGKHKTMSTEQMMNSVANDSIQFVTERPPGSKFALLERRVIVIGPRELVELTQSGDPRMLPLLAELLKDPARAWAAEVVLASLTRREEKQVDSFAGCPEKWWAAVGQGAHERWSSWMLQVAGKLEWDASQ